MSIEPHEPSPFPVVQPAAPVQQTPPGWYPDRMNPGIQRYWDGYRWTEHVAPLQQGMPQQVVVVGGQQGGGYVSGLTTGEHILHGILTLCTCGLWGFVWASKAALGRRRIR